MPRLHPRHRAVPACERACPDVRRLLRSLPRPLYSFTRFFPHGGGNQVKGQTCPHALVRFSVPEGERTLAGGGTTGEAIPTNASWWGAGPEKGSTRSTA